MRCRTNPLLLDALALLQPWRAGDPRCPTIKVDRRTLRLIIEVSQQFELHDNRRRMPFGNPSPHAVAVGLEPGTHERLLESCRADGTGGDLEIDLNVDVCGAHVPPTTACAQ